MIPNLLKIILFFNLLLTSMLNAQEIWHESFSVPEKGIWGNENGMIQSDFSGITNWSIEYSNVRLVNIDDYCKTVATSGGRFEIRDADGEVKWLSEIIHTDGYSNVKIELTAAETGSNNNSATKYIKAFYKSDGGDEIPFETNGVNTGNWGSNLANQTVPAGAELQIVVYLANSYSSDRVILDEVIVYGEENKEPIKANDILISEILFNPFAGGSDFVEIYNNSDNEISTKRLRLASRDKDLELTQVCQLSSKKSFLPGEYLCLTRDTSGIFPFFNIKCTSCFLQLEKFPSYNNDEDYVVLLNENLEIIDELVYSDKWHAPLLADEKGISLERISFSAATNDVKNWYSASTKSGYGTPGYQNSQFGSKVISKPKISFTPESFSPNFDGYNDEYQIHFELDKPGYVANVSVFDAAGRFVLKLANNYIMGTSQTLGWNGEDENGQKQNLGIYVVFVEIFDQEGNVFHFKDGVVLTDVLE